MTDGRQPGNDRGKEQGAKSPARRERLAQALKANIARRKEAARSRPPHGADQAAAPAPTPAGDAAAAPDNAPAAAPPGAARRR